MEMKTLDEYLDEINRWKEAARVQRRGLSDLELAEHYREVRAWWEAKLGHPLPEADWLQHQEQVPANPLAPDRTSSESAA
jgi:hypothetical protein